MAEGGSEAGGFVSGLDYPMFVVTTAADGERAGCLVGFATQTSIDPFRFLVCLSRRNRTFRVAGSATYAAVHRLGKNQSDLAVLFGAETGDEIDKFARCGWRAGPGGVPLLDACPETLTGSICDRLDLGDHSGLLLAPVGGREWAGGAGAPRAPVVRGRGESPRVGPLMFSDLPDLDPGHPA